MQVYVQGALQKMQLIAFFALYRKSLNAICIPFQFFNPKLKSGVLNRISTI